MTKYREYFERMVTNEKEVFDAFIKLHMKYSLDQDGLQEEFNKEGAKVLTIIREWEQKLCSQSEKAGFGNYTTNLSEKFMLEVRKSFPLIDHVGVIIKKSNNNEMMANKKMEFEIKKISFNK